MSVEPVVPPLLTYCDERTGERVDLSAAQLGGWAARVSALLRDGCGLGEGSNLAVLLPPHWLTAAAVLGAWSSGVAISFRGWATAGLPVLGPGADAPLGATFVAASRIGSWLEDIPSAPHQFSFFASQPPLGYRDFETELAQYPEHAPPPGRTRPGDSATVDGTSYGALGRVATELAERMGLPGGGRLAVDASADEHALKWLLAPLSAGASVVVIAGATPEAFAERAQAEGATYTLR